MNAAGEAGIIIFGVIGGGWILVLGIYYCWTEMFTD